MYALVPFFGEISNKSTMYIGPTIFWLNKVLAAKTVLGTVLNIILAIVAKDDQTTKIHWQKLFLIAALKQALNTRIFTPIFVQTVILIG